MTQNMVVKFGNNETNKKKAVVEADKYLVNLAKKKGIELEKLINSDFEDLSPEERTDLFLYSSVVLSKEAERIMINEFRSDREKLNHLLFNHNARAATMLAALYCYKFKYLAKNAWRYTMEDFLSSARYGLWMAAKRFDLDRKRNGKPVKFLTFASSWMFRYISDMVRESESKVDKVSLDAPAYSGDDDSCPMIDVFDSDSIADGFRQMLDDDGNEIDLEEENEFGLNGNECADDNYEQYDELDATKHLDTLRKLAKGESGQNQKNVFSAIGFLCDSICSITDPEVRVVALFISKKLITHGLASIDKTDYTKNMARVERLMKHIPMSKPKLLSLLGLNMEQFKKMCNKYAYKLMAEKD